MRHLVRVPPQRPLGGEHRIQGPALHPLGLPGMPCGLRRLPAGEPVEQALRHDQRRAGDVRRAGPQLLLRGEVGQPALELRLQPARPRRRRLGADPQLLAAAWSSSNVVPVVPVVDLREQARPHLAADLPTGASTCSRSGGSSSPNPVATAQSRARARSTSSDGSRSRSRYVVSVRPVSSR